MYHEFISKAHIKPINEFILELFCIELRLKYFCLGLACLLNKYKTKAQAWLIYKQTNMNKFFYQVESKFFMNNLVHLQSYFLWAIKELILANNSGSDKTKVIVSITSLSLLLLLVATTLVFGTILWKYMSQCWVTQLSFSLPVMLHYFFFFFFCF